MDLWGNHFGQNANYYQVTEIINTYSFIGIPRAPDECIHVAMCYFINPIYFQYGKETATAITATST
jgi:hypothetical protein